MYVHIYACMYVYVYVCIFVHTCVLYMYLYAYVACMYEWLCTQCTHTENVYACHVLMIYDYIRVYTFLSVQNERKNNVFNVLYIATIC